MDGRSGTGRRMRQPPQVVIVVVVVVLFRHLRAAAVDAVAVAVDAAAAVDDPELARQLVRHRETDSSPESESERASQ